MKRKFGQIYNLKIKLKLMKFYLLIFMILMFANCSGQDRLNRAITVTPTLVKDSITFENLQFKKYDNFFIKKHFNSKEQAIQEGREQPFYLLRQYISVTSQDWMDSLFVNKKDAPKWDFQFLNGRKRFEKFEILHTIKFKYNSYSYVFLHTKFYNNPIAPLGFKNILLKKYEDGWYITSDVKDENLKFLIDWGSRIKTEVGELFILQPMLIQEKIKDKKPIFREMLYYTKSGFKFNLKRFMEKTEKWEKNGEFDKINFFFKQKERL